MTFGVLAPNYWLEFLFGIMATLMTTGFVWVWKRFRTSQREQTSIKNGIKALLRDRIIRTYNHYREKGCCPIYGLENIDDMYREYRALGGNGVVTRLVEELKDLPRDPARKEKEETSWKT